MKHKKIYAALAIAAISVGPFAFSGNQTAEALHQENHKGKIVICHATGAEANPFVRIEVSANAEGGHFNEAGSPLDGHEDDILLAAGGECPTGVGGGIGPQGSPSPLPDGRGGGVGGDITGVGGVGGGIGAATGEITTYANTAGAGETDFWLTVAGLMCMTLGGGLLLRSRAKGA